MMISQNNADNSLQANGMKADEYGVVPFPLPPLPPAASKVASHVAGINMSIFKNTKNKDAALKFVKFMTAAEEQKTLGKPFASLPVVKGATTRCSPRRRRGKTFADVLATSPSRCRWCPRRPVREHRRQGHERSCSPRSPPARPVTARRRQGGADRTATSDDRWLRPAESGTAATVPTGPDDHHERRRREAPARVAPDTDPAAGAGPAARSRCARPTCCCCRPCCWNCSSTSSRCSSASG